MDLNKRSFCYAKQLEIDNGCLERRKNTQQEASRLPIKAMLRIAFSTFPPDGMSCGAFAGVSMATTPPEICFPLSLAAVTQALAHGRFHETRRLTFSKAA